MTDPGPEPRRPSAPLDEGEQRALSHIERQLRSEAPDLAGAFDDVAGEGQRTGRERLARRMIGVGLLVVFIGLVTQNGLLSLGAIVLGYGLLSVGAGAVLLLRNHSRPVS